MIRVPRTAFNGSFITRHFFPEYLKHNNVRGINSGRCYDWAYLAYRMYSNVQLWSTDYHAWIQIGRKYYDSESGKYGVLNFMNLGCNRRNACPLPWESQPPVRQTVEEFKDFWNREGGGHRRHWDSLLEHALKKTLGNRYAEATPIFQLPRPARTIP